MLNPANTTILNNFYSFVDLSYRPLIDYISFKNKENSYNERIQGYASLALFCLNFYQPIAPYLFMATEFMKSHQFYKLGNNESEGDKFNSSVCFFLATGSVVSAVSSFFSYRVGLAVFVSLHLVNCISLIAIESLFSLFEETSIKKQLVFGVATGLTNALHLVTILKPSPKRFVISSVACMAWVAYSTYNAKNEDSTPLTFTQKVKLAAQVFLLEGLYGYQVKQQAQLANLKVGDFFR